MLRKLSFITSLVVLMFAGEVVGNDSASKLDAPGISMAAPKKEKPVRPIPRQQWNYLTKLWLARSCVGEAGFQEVDECIGIAWTMATRSTEYRTNFLRVVQGYSFAVKNHSGHRRPWIFQLGMKGDKPEDWPSKLNWKFHRRLWFKLLDTLDKWAKGKVPNPVDGANHFGGDMDTPGVTWLVVKPKFGFEFKNTFYRQDKTPGNK